MECLQYGRLSNFTPDGWDSFKSCYKWNAFNTLGDGVMKILLYGKF